MDIFKKIECEIASKRVNKTELAAKIGITRNTVYNLNEKTAIGTIFKIIEALGMKPADFFKEKEKVHGLSLVHEEGEVYGIVNYKEKYFEALEKLNHANERLLCYSDLKKETIKPKK